MFLPVEDKRGVREVEEMLEDIRGGLDHMGVICLETFKHGAQINILNS